MTDLTALSADQLAEKVRLHVVVLMHTHRLGREDDAHTVFEALAELVRRLNTAEEELAAYREPGWIATPQKVLEERARAEAAEARVTELEAVLDTLQAELRQWKDDAGT